MNDAAPDNYSSRITYPPGFRARRGLNWGFLGLLYTSFYMCRYNLSIANGSISKEFGFTRADMGVIITTSLLAYAFGQIINGLICDKIGGKRSMLIGAAGTVVMNFLFGAVSMFGFYAPATNHDSLALYQARASVEFVTNDFADVNSLARKLDHDTNTSTTNISYYLKTQFGEGTRQLLASAQGTNMLSPALPKTLVEDLNFVIHGTALYDTNRFRGVAFSRGVTNLLATAKTGPDLVRLNRVLLDEAYPQEIRASSHWLLRIPFFHIQLFLGLLSLFVAVRGIDGYMQAYGAPGMIKINTAWFAQRERGRFAGIFGFMINLGRFGIFKLGPALLAGFTFLWMWQIPPLHWRWLFWIPSGICAVVAVGMALTVKETPEAAGFHDTRAAEPKPVAGAVEVGFMELLIKLLSNPTIWIVALAYACTGSVRQSLDQWWPRFLTEVWKIDFDTVWHLHLLKWNSAWNAFSVIGCLIPLVASMGSLISGYLSDIVFKGRRAPVAAGIYFLETAIILLAAQCHSAGYAVFFVILISLTANSTHSLLGTAAAMDIGGRKQSGFASGVIDSFQYFGGSLAGYFLGRLLDKSWGYYFYFMAPFGLLGGILMLFMMGKIKPKPQPAPTPIPASTPK